MKTTTSLFLLSACFFLWNPANVEAQQTDDDQNVKQVIEQLFDGMRSSDSSLVRKSFIDDAIMQTVTQNEDGQAKVKSSSLQGFLHAVGTPKEEIWDERISTYEIKIDGDLASAWTPYSFYAGEKFSHCGVNSFQLVRTEESWKIFFIVDTRRTTDCDA